MKMNKIVAVSVAACVAVSCASAKAKVKEQKVVVERIDWQGQATGSDIPDWVKAVSDNNKRKVSKELDLDDYMVWSFNASGSDLEFLETWTDKVELQSNVAQAISTEIGRATQAAADMEMKDADEATKQKTIKDVTTVLSNVRVTGLERFGSYWVKTRSTSAKKPKKDSDWEVKYTYYAVWAMPKTSFQAALEDAEKTFTRENTSQDPILQKMITASIAQTILGNIDASVVSFDDAIKPE